MKKTVKQFCISILLIAVEFNTVSVYASNGNNFAESSHTILYSYYKEGVTKLEYDPITGKYSGFFQNGEVWENGVWNNKNMVGQHISYYKNQNLRHELNYNASGLKDGLQIYYHSNGVVSMKGHWINGKINGSLARYDKSGNIKTVVEYDNGKIVKNVYPVQ